MAVAAFVVYLAAYADRQDEILPNERMAEEPASLRSSGGVFAAVNLYFIQAAGLRTWLYCLIVYPLRYYPSPTINNWRVLIDGFPSHAGLITWVVFSFVYATVPLVYFVFFVGRGNYGRRMEERPGQTYARGYDWIGDVSCGCLFPFIEEAGHSNPTGHDSPSLAAKSAG